MDPTALFREIMATYRKFGWRLRRVLLSAATDARLGGNSETLFGPVEIRASTIDALWFSRPSHEAREAWELRLVSELPYALFETFEEDEAEEDREDVRREMEARLIARASGGPSLEVESNGDGPEEDED